MLRATAKLGEAAVTSGGTRLTSQRAKTTIPAQVILRSWYIGAQNVELNVEEQT